MRKIQKFWGDLPLDKLTENIQSKSTMKKYKKHHAKRTVRLAKTSKPSEAYMIVVRSWMLVVVFALMLGIGWVTGSFLNQKLNESTPQVAGASVER